MVAFMRQAEIIDATVVVVVVTVAAVTVVVVAAVVGRRQHVGEDGPTVRQSVVGTRSVLLALHAKVSHGRMSKQGCRHQRVPVRSRICGHWQVTATEIFELTRTRDACMLLVRGRHGFLLQSHVHLSVQLHLLGA